MDKSENNFIINREKLLIVDDQVSVLSALESLLKERYQVSIAESGEEALELIRQDQFDLVITDIKMPGMNGIVLLENIYQIRPKPQVAVILMTAYGSVEVAVHAMRYGAYDFIIKPFRIDEMLMTIEKASERRKLEIENQELTLQLQHINQELELIVEERTQELNDSKKALEKNYLEVVQTLAVAIEEKDPYTHGHSARVTKYSVAVAKEMGLSSQECKTLETAGILHDIGKIGIDEKILQKKGPLSQEEKLTIWDHPEIGERILQPIELMREVRQIIRHHHERYDGGGYPDGLKGFELDLSSRIIATADSFDAMTSNRPYRAALNLKEALIELKNCSGSQFDPQVVEIFIKMIKRGEIKI